MSSNAIKAKIVQETVERYNLIKKFLTTFENDADSQFASYLITEMLKSLKTDELSEYDRMLAYVKKAVASSRHVKVSEVVESSVPVLLELEAQNQDAMLQALSQQTIKFSNATQQADLYDKISAIE